MHNYIMQYRLQLLLVVLFLVYPISALPFIFIEIYNRKFYAFILLAFFMGLCAILFPPYADLYRHTLFYFDCLKTPCSDWIVTTSGYDFLLYTITNVFAKLGVNFELVRFLFAFSSYYISFFIFRDIVKHNKDLQEDNKYYFITFLCVFLAVPFLWLVNGLRYMMAAMLVILSIYQVFFQNRRVGYLWLFVASSLHFGVLMFLWVMLIFGVVKNIRLSRKFTIMATFLCFVFSTTFMMFVLEIMPVDETLKSAGNIYIKNTSYFAENRSLFGVIANLMERSSLPLLIIMLLVEKTNSRIISLFFAYFVLLGLVQPFMVLFDRLTLTVMPLFLFGVISYFKKTKFKTLMFQLLLVSYLITNVAYMYGYRAPLLQGRTYQLLYKSCPILLINNYDQWWVEQHLDFDGEFR